MKIAFVYCIEENLGIEYLSAVLKKAGHDTNLVFDPRLFDFNHKAYSIRFLKNLFDFRHYLLDGLVKMSPDLVAFSAVSPNYQWAVEFARQVRERISTPIVFGGLHPTFVPERAMANPFIDYLIRGEGEYPLLELVESLERGSPDLKIPNLWTRSNGNIIRNPMRPLIQNLDSLPFPDKELFYKLGPPFDVAHMTMASRGCTYACTFCGVNPLRKAYFGSNNILDPSFLRLRSVDNMVAEIKIAKEKYGSTVVRFNDDDLAVNEEWLREFSQKYPREAGLPYKCFVNPLSINERTVEYLKKSGCDQAQMGVQSISPAIRKKIGRPMPTSAISRAVNLITEAKIILLTDNLFGLPGETENDLKETVKFYMENPVDFANIFWLTYFATADIVDEARKEGILKDEDIERIEKEPFQGVNQNRGDLHPKTGVPYQMMIEVINHFPKWLAKIIIALGLHRVFMYVNIFPYIKALRILKPKKADHVPRPNEGYDIFALRYRRLILHYMARKLRMTWLGSPS